MQTVLPSRKLSVGLFPWPWELVCSHGVPAGVGGRDKGMLWRKVVWRRSLWFVGHGVRGGNGEHAMHSSPEHGMRPGSGELGTAEGESESSVSLPASLAGGTFVLVRGVFWGRPGGSTGAGVGESFPLQCWGEAGHWALGNRER